MARTAEHQSPIPSSRVAVFFWRHIEGQTVNCRAAPRALCSSAALMGAMLVTVAALHAELAGDANCDGVVNDADLVAVGTAAFEGSTCAAADANGDGAISAADLPAEATFIVLAQAPTRTATATFPTALINLDTNLRHGNTPRNADAEGFSAANSDAAGNADAIDDAVGHNDPVHTIAYTDNHRQSHTHCHTWRVPEPRSRSVDHGGQSDRCALDTGHRERPSHHRVLPRCRRSRGDV